ncbi:MAG TPA: lysylphosphatidylglycerol synthase domain-containing protein, partial [Mycobacteriales bacterium]|nr:lysylphosphatidylglycerol synthase domain-containing protein [Mycobacteriales bacterium]
LLAAGFAALGVALAVPRSRPHVLGLFRALADVTRRPRCLASLVVGCAGVTVAQLLTLHGAVRAVGGHLPWVELLATLMGSAAARSAVPSPGGVGPVEAALVGGLSALGLGLGTAAAAVAVYRTAGHWLPVLGGVASLRSLRRAELV